MSNITSLVKKDGFIILSGLRNCECYKVGGIFFPSANINEVDLQNSLIRNGFSLVESIKVCNVPKCSIDGFSSIMFGFAKKIGD
jgi:hypothetical protein